MFIRRFIGRSELRVFPSQYPRMLPMVAVEVKRTMAKKSRKPAQLEKILDSDWLYELLADTRAHLAGKPSPEAIARIRATLMAELDRPGEIAA